MGEYRVDVKLSGFAPVSQEIELAVGTAIDLPIVLSVAGVTESVVGHRRDRRALTSRVRKWPSEFRRPRSPALPLNGRNYLDLALLAPGVNRTNIRNTERFAETSAVPGTGLSVLGQRNIGNTFVVDGVSGNDDAADLAGTYLSQEVIREFQVITNGASAEFGRSTSGAFNIVTQSGANRTNGSAYGFFRDDRFDARNAFRHFPGSAVAAAVRRDSLGGPITRDRTFYFVNAEQTLNERTAYISISDANVSAVNQVLDGVGYRGPRIATGAFTTGYDTTNLFGRVDAQLIGRAISSPGATASTTSPARTRAASAG